MYNLNRYFLLGCILLAPLTAKPATISVNSACQVNCPSSGALTDGTSTNGPFNFNVGFGDGDTYNVSGTYAASYSTANGSTIYFDPVVTYTGSVASVGNDTINISMIQSYYDTTCCTWAGEYTESVPLFLSSDAGAGSSISAQLLYDGVSVGLIGPYSAGTYLVSQSSDLDFGDLDTSPTLTAEYDFTVQFDEGTLPDAGAASSSTPEPIMTIPCGLGLVLIGLARRRGTRSK